MKVSAILKKYIKFLKTVAEPPPGHAIHCVFRYTEHLASISQQHPHSFTGLKTVNKTKVAIGHMDELDTDFKGWRNKKIFKERKKNLRDQLNRFGLPGIWKSWTSRLLLFSQLYNTRNCLRITKRRYRKPLNCWVNSSLFREFHAQARLLAALFRLPGDAADPVTNPAYGLQTRVQVNNLHSTAIGNGGRDARIRLVKNMQEAQSYLTQLKNKIYSTDCRRWWAGYAKGFRPNSQKDQKFLERIELGTNTNLKRLQAFSAYYRHRNLDGI